MSEINTMANAAKEAVTVGKVAIEATPGSMKIVALAAVGTIGVATGAYFGGKAIANKLKKTSLPLVGKKKTEVVEVQTEETVE